MIRTIWWMSDWTYIAWVFSRRIEWLTKSNAFRKSTNRVPTKSPLSIHSIQWSISLISAVWQLCFCLKPDCPSCKSLYLFRYPIKWRLICFSKIFKQNWDWPIIRCPGPLKIGNTLAFFNWSGNIPIFKLLFISYWLLSEKIWQAILRILEPSPSIPMAFDGSSLLMKDVTCSHVTGGIWKYVCSGILV